MPSGKMKHQVAWTMLLFLSAAAMTPVCSVGQTRERIERDRIINLGFSTDRPPFSSLSTQGKPAGYAIDMCMHVVDLIQARLPDLKVYFVPVDKGSEQSMLEEGKIDLSCGAITETLTARERVSFSLPIYFTGVGVMVRKDSPAALLRVLSGQISHAGPTWRATVNAGLANHSYAVHAGTVRESWVRDRIARLGVIAKITVVDTYAAGLDLLSAGRVDAFFADRAGLDSTAAVRPEGKQLIVLERRFTVEPMAFAMARGDEDFRLIVDTALSRLYRNGDYLNTYLDYFGEPSDTARLLFEGYALR
jgi:polar amino acid transport system substrate-binding protein